MSEFIETLKELYEEKKDIDNPPSYLETVKEILDIDDFLNNPKDNQGTN